MPSRLHLSILALLLNSTFAAEPTPGNYLGTFKVTRNPQSDFPIVTRVKAAAKVLPNGQVSIWLFTSPSPFPDSAPLAFRMKVGADGSCVLPKSQPNPAAPSTLAEPAATTDSSEFSVGPGPIVILNPTIPEFHGQVNATSNTFTLSYDDVPDRYTNSNGETVIVNFCVAILPTAEFQFTFSKMTSTTTSRLDAGRTRK
jgi:hypothetical protein